MRGLSQENVSNFADDQDASATSPELHDSVRPYFHLFRISAGTDGVGLPLGAAK